MTISQAIPFYKGRPIVNTLPDMGFNRLNFLYQLSRECPDLCAFRFGRHTIYLASSPEVAHTVLVEKAESFEKPKRMYRDFGPIIGNGLLTSQQSFHRRQRRLVAPAFHHRRLTTYAETMSKYAELICTEWSDGQSIEMVREMVRLTLWIVGKTLFDAEILDEADDVGKAVTTVMHIFNNRLILPYNIPLEWPTPSNRRIRQTIEQLDSVIYGMIRKRRETNEDRGDLLSMLLQARDEDDGSFMTDQQVRDESMTLFLAGHETTANALAWSWYLLANHPHSYAKLQKESQTVLAGRSPTFADLPQLPYAVQVFKEAMRLYPPVYMIGRRSIKSVQLGPYNLPAGVAVLISPYAMHRKEDHFPDPQRFIPERWTPSFEQSLPKQAYIPFGGGPRICIGNNFALMEGQLILSTLAQRVTFKLLPGQRVKSQPLIALRPNAVKMRVRHKNA